MSLRLGLAIRVGLAALALLAGLWWLHGRVREEGLDESLRSFAVTWMEAGGRARCEADPERFVVDTIAPPPRRGPPPPDAEGDLPWPGPGPGPRPHRRPGAGPGPGPGGPPGPPGPPGGAGFLPGPRPPPPGRVAPGTRLWAYGADFGSRNPAAPRLPEALTQPLRAGAGHAGVDAEVEGRPGRRLLVRMAWNEGPCALVLVERAYPEPADAERTLLLGAAALVVGLLLAMLIAAGPLVRRIRRMTQEVARSAREGYATPVTVEGSDEIAALARAFDEAHRAVRAQVARAEERERSLRAFVANTTHDTMLPLTVLQGHLTALKARGADGPTAPPGGAPEAEGAPAGPAASDAILLRQALEEAHYLGCILGNLAAAAKLEAGDVHLALAPVDLEALVGRVRARHLPIARSAGVTLEDVLPPEPVRVLGDVTLLEQAVSNLVHNAVRYSDPGGRVAIVLEAPRAAPRFSLRVVDEGPGLSAAELARATERHFRGRAARTRAQDGAGLGLWIARDVAERHGFGFELRSPADLGEGPPRGLEARLSGPRLGDGPSAAPPAPPAEPGRAPPAGGQ